MVACSNTHSQPGTGVCARCSRTTEISSIHDDARQTKYRPQQIKRNQLPIAARVYSEQSVLWLTKQWRHGTTTKTRMFYALYTLRHPPSAIRHGMPWFGLVSLRTVNFVKKKPHLGSICDAMWVAVGHRYQPAIQRQHACAFDVLCIDAW